MGIQIIHLYFEKPKCGSHHLTPTNLYLKSFKFLKYVFTLSFICNSEKHWFTIRKINKIWYNLNSTNQYPEIISDFYLSAFLQSVNQNGYQIFIVKGLIPETQQEVFFHKRTMSFKLISFGLVKNYVKVINKTFLKLEIH